MRRRGVRRAQSGPHPLQNRLRGEIYQFEYHQQCGEPCGERFTIRRCPAPSVTNRSFSCFMPANSTDRVQLPQEYILPLAGPDALDCGPHGIAAGEDALEQSITCAIRASERREAFQTMKQDQGIDSMIYQGLFGRADGTLFRFGYDSAPCGGRGCFGRFTLERCPQPRLVHRGVPRITCVEGRS